MTFVTVSWVSSTANQNHLPAPVAELIRPGFPKFWSSEILEWPASTIYFLTLTRSLK